MYIWGSEQFVKMFPVRGGCCCCCLNGHGPWPWSESVFLKLSSWISSGHVHYHCIHIHTYRIAD